MIRWYVVATRPSQEERATENLRRQGFDVWFPRVQRTRRRARRFDTVLCPLFPGYLFVRLDLGGDHWRPISSTFGVRRLICGDSGPCALPEGFVAELMSQCEGGILWDHVRRLEAGSKVRVVTGPFVDCIGTLICADSATRVRLLLSVLGGAVETVLPSAAVAPAA